MNQIERLELTISKFLRWGVIASIIPMGIGLLYSLFFSNHSFEALKTYSSFSLFKSIELSIATKDWGTLISYLGLICLISLPIIRVFLTGILFFKQKEKIMGLLSLFVFLALTLSFFLGIEH